MNLEDMSDSDLISFMNNGQKEKAFNILYKRYNKEISSYCFYLSRNKDTAREIVDLTFEKLWNYSCNYISDKSFKSWIYRIAKNNFIDEFRKKRNYSRRIVSESEIFKPESENLYSEIEFYENNSNFEDSPHEILEKRENYLLLDKALDKLRNNPYFFNIIQMRYFEELSYEEIAERMEIPLGTVKNGIFRAKRQLGKVFQSKVKTFKSNSA